MKIKEHLLVCLTEECAEIIKVASKALRFGLEDGYPGETLTNHQALHNEINDLKGVLELLKEHGLFPDGYLDLNKITEKKNKVKKYMEYARNKGTLDKAGKR